ncbi:phytanoyl-CoA dioxygenase family protein [Sphingomonas sp.]|uniref:phytanoyl-CoA dioxygenase family protein n=1 Tax=Sphingomonas sp. TaxID=28214 RepID=UPI0031D89074
MTDTIAAPASAERWSEALLEQGYCIIRGALPKATVSALDENLADDFARTPFCQGGFYGATTKRFGRLLIRSRHAASLVQHETMLGIADKVLSPWCDRIQLNVTQAIAIHPGAPSQLPHRDQDMWRAPAGAAEYLINVIWPLTAFTAENGATVIWPNSHGANALAPEPTSEPLAAEMAPGDALLFLGSTLHGAGANRTAEVRRGIVVGYSLGWLKPYENQHLAYPPEVARTFPPALAALVGYRQHRPNLGNYEGQCPSVLLEGRADEPLGAIDALRPDQAAMVDAYVASQAT